MHRVFAPRASGVGMVMVVLAYSAMAAAGEHKVLDDAHLFSATAIEQADRTMELIRQQLHKDLMVETFAAIPPELRDKFREQDKETFYNNWVIAEARARGVNGVFVLVTLDPPHVQVGVGNDTRQKAFTMADRDRLLKGLTNAFKARDYDGGLIKGAEFVRQVMATNEGIELPAAAPPATTAAATTRPAASEPGEAPDPPRNNR